MRHLPTRSPLLPALRNADAALDRLQARQQALVDAGRPGESARLWGRIARVARWQMDAENPRPAPRPAPVRAQVRPQAQVKVPAAKVAPVRDWLTSLMAEVDVAAHFDMAA